MNANELRRIAMAGCWREQSQRGGRPRARSQIRVRIQRSSSNKISRNRSKSNARGSNRFAALWADFVTTKTKPSTSRWWIVSTMQCVPSSALITRWDSSSTGTCATLKPYLNGSRYRRHRQHHIFLIGLIDKRIDGGPLFGFFFSCNWLVLGLRWFDSKVWKWTQDNDFIWESYRPVLPSFIHCFKSVFSVHNETGNIWTHMLGCIAFIAIGYSVIFDCEQLHFIWMNEIISN